MPKYYKKRYYRGSRDKYSVEQQAGTVTTNSSGTGGVSIVPSTSTQGMRKVKHLTVSMATGDGSGSASTSVLYYALVYVPQGTSANTLQIDSGTMYEPNQFVMCCGVFDFDGGPLRIHCPISRNLNSGDSVALVVQNTSGVKVYNYVVRYAITLQ